MHYTTETIKQCESISSITALFAIAISTFLFLGCQSKVTVSPQLQSSNRKLECFQGKVVYDGNQLYLPRTINDCKTEVSDIEYVYKYDIKYLATPAAAELGAAFIPTTIVGTPTGHDLVKVEVSLDITACTKRIRKFEASCELRSYRGVFAGATDNYSLRKQCLLLARDNIEQQMLAEQSLLESLSRCSQ